VSLQRYVESLIALGDKESLEFARSLAQDHPAWMIKIVPLLARFDGAAHSKPAPGE